MLEEALLSGDLLLGILGLILIEALVLFTAGRRMKVPLISVLPNLASGAFLMSAIYVALTSRNSTALLALLSAALVAHLVDLLPRLYRPGH